MRGAQGLQLIGSKSALHLLRLLLQARHFLLQAGDVTLHVFNLGIRLAGGLQNKHQRNKRTNRNYRGQSPRQSPVTERFASEI